MNKNAAVGLLVCFLCWGCNLDDTLNPKTPQNNQKDNCVPESDEALCIKFGQKCSDFVVNDQCGNARNIVCDQCEVGTFCQPQSQVCSPCAGVNFCQDAGADCGRLDAPVGSVQERCGITSIGCGTCADGSTCENNSCTSCVGEPEELLCGKDAKQCGTHQIVDRCGVAVEADCGMCAEGECLADGTCSVCQPETDAQFCARLGATCGGLTQMDNCGMMRTANCGGCQADEECNNNMCECPDPACLSGVCGVVANACGKSIDCGGCSGADVCQNNACACAPESKAAFCANNNAQCGQLMASDQCGTPRVEDCGTCPNNQACQADNTCQCEPETMQELQTQHCANLECGTVAVTNRCGQPVTVTCGSCNGNEVCSNNLCCQPQTAAQACAAQNTVCGSIDYTDGCSSTSRTADCGTCSGLDICFQTTCAPVVVSNTADNFGTSVAMDDGHMIVGAPDRDGPTGKVMYYNFVDKWTNAKTFNAPGNEPSFGWSVDINVLSAVVGAPEEEKAYIVEFSGASPKMEAQYPQANIGYPNEKMPATAVAIDQALGTKLTAVLSNPSNDINTSNGSYTDIGGFAYFDKNSSWADGRGNGFWFLGPQYEASYLFSGLDVDMCRGRRAFTLPKLEEVVVEVYGNGRWNRTAIITRAGSATFGIRIDFSPGCKYLAVTEGNFTLIDTLNITNQFPGTGGFDVHIFEDTSGSGTTWTHRQTLPAPPNSRFGYDVAMGDDHMFVADPTSTGKVYHYKRSGTNWSMANTLSGVGALALDFDNRYVAIGNPTASSGKVHIYEAR